MDPVEPGLARDLGFVKDPGEVLGVTVIVKCISTLRRLAALPLRRLIRSRPRRREPGWRTTRVEELRRKVGVPVQTCSVADARSMAG